MRTICAICPSVTFYFHSTQLNRIIKCTLTIPAGECVHATHQDVWFNRTRLHFIIILQHFNDKSGRWTAYVCRCASARHITNDAQMPVWPHVRQSRVQTNVFAQTHTMLITRFSLQQSPKLINIHNLLLLLSGFRSDATPIGPVRPPLYEHTHTKCTPTWWNVDNLCRRVLYLSRPKSVQIALFFNFLDLSRWRRNKWRQRFTCFSCHISK